MSRVTPFPWIIPLLKASIPCNHYVPLRIHLDFLPEICEKANEIGLSLIH